MTQPQPTQAAPWPAPVAASSKTRSVARTAVKALLIAAGVAAAVFVWRERPVRARAAIVDRGEVRTEVVGTGTVESDEQVTLAFVVPGRVASLAVDEGDIVHPGDVIATLDVADAERQLGVARANEGTTGTSIARVVAEVARAKATREASAKDLVRSQTLAAQGSVSQATLDAAQERSDRAEADWTAAIASVAQARAAASAAHESSGMQARRLDDGKLVSPVEGVVLERKHVVGDVVGVGTAVLVVASTRKVRVRAWVDETSLGSLRVGAETRVELRSAQGSTLRGRLERVASQADRQTHEVLVDVELLERPDRLAFGQRADVAILVAHRPNVARIPAGFCDVPAQSCFIDRAGRVVRVHATFGLEGTGTIEVTSGVEPGDALLAPVSSEAALREGRRVRRTL